MTTDDAKHVEDLRKSLLRITDEAILDRLPYGSVIVARSHDTPGIHTLVKIDQEEWSSFTVYGDPTMTYQIEEEEPITPSLPALLVSCGDQLPEIPKPKLVLIQGEAE